MYPSRFHSDIIENNFCQVRWLSNGNTTNPTYSVFHATMNSIILGQSSVSRRGNPYYHPIVSIWPREEKKMAEMHIVQWGKIRKKDSTSMRSILLYMTDLHKSRAIDWLPRYKIKTTCNVLDVKKSIPRRPLFIFCFCSFQTWILNDESHWMI